MPLVFNATVLVGHKGEIIGTYDKMHRVMFGEYIPFADWFPFLYGITPLTGGIVAGEEPAALRLDGVYCFSPSICYETVIPHVIRRQVATLENRDEYPNALVNVTNDAWYWGSSELDMHLACGVFRAVETRLPLVIAANGGISAWIDHLGRVRAKSPRQQADFHHRRHRTERDSKLLRAIWRLVCRFVFGLLHCFGRTRVEVQA